MNKGTGILVERLKCDFPIQGDLLNYQKRIEALSGFLIHLEEGFKNMEGHAAQQSFKGGERQ